jgi:subtilisin family serine protease
MRSILALSSVILALMTASVVLGSIPLQKESMEPYWAFVKVTDTSILPEVGSSLRESGIELGPSFTYVPFVQARIRSVTDLNAALSIPGVIAVMEQAPVSSAMNVSVRSVKAEPSALYSPQTARDLGYAGKGIAIAIIDGGVDDEHPAFANAFVAGADFTSPPSPLNPRDGSVNPDDVEGHGTSVASVALGRGDQNGDFKGMAPEAGLIDLRIRKVGLTLPGPMTDAIEWCIANKDTDWGNGHTGVNVISISAGLGQAGGPVDLAVTRAVSEGMVVISAATNSGSSYEDNTNNRNDYWADDSIIAGGTDTLGTIDRTDDVFWDQSTWGPRTADADDDFYDELKPDVSAPGADLMLAAFSRNSGTAPASGYVIGSGTSFSTPHASGLAALMLEANPNMVPGPDVNPIRLTLHKSSEARGEVYDQDMSLKYDVHYGYGIIDAYEAIRAAKDYRVYESSPTIVSFTSAAAKATSGGTVGISALAIDDQEQKMTYTVTSAEGTIADDPAPRTWIWTAPAEPGMYTISLTVTDTSDLSSTSELQIEVVEGSTNTPPTIESIEATRTLLKTGDECDIRVKASDPDLDTLTYSYSASIGEITGEGYSVSYTAPDTPGTAIIEVTVRDPFGASDTGEVTITVQEDVFGDPPSIKGVVFDPDSFRSGYGGYVSIHVTVSMETYEILFVNADLSAMGLGIIALYDNGADPDKKASDRTYSAYLGDVGGIGQGRYSITVTAADVAGFQSTKTVDLVVDKGDGDGDGMSIVGVAASIVAVLAILLLIIAAIAFIVVRMARKA